MKATMPEPVAWRYTDARGHYRYRGYIARFDSLYPILRPEPLITTTQAEAYADARVREMLEEAISLSSMYGATIELDAAIRALIPKQPGLLAAKETP